MRVLLGALLCKACVVTMADCFSLLLAPDSCSLHDESSLPTVSLMLQKSDACKQKDGDRESEDDGKLENT